VTGLEDIVGPNAGISSLKAHSKKQALQEIASRVAAITRVPEREIFDTLIQRERLGSTGIGNGIAIPHGRVVGLDHVVGVFARLDEPIEFEAIDDKPVDLIFVLLAPEGSGADHLKALARVARLLRGSDTAAKLRATDDAKSLYGLLTRPSATAA
jgi:PTS system nitrogen regulatory IIA component